MSYIEREELFKTVEDYASTHPVMHDSELFALFCSVHAADVRTVVIAAWKRIDFKPYGHDYECSACGWKNDMPTHFCPNCGAKMEEK